MSDRIVEVEDDFMQNPVELQDIQLRPQTPNQQKFQNSNFLMSSTVSMQEMELLNKEAFLPTGEQV